MISDYSYSNCGDGWLHKFVIVRQNPEYTMELCERCRKVEYFPNNIDSYSYLLYHIREAIQPGHPNFFREYPKAGKYTPK